MVSMEIYCNRLNPYPRKYLYWLFFGFLLSTLSACGSRVPELQPLAEDAVILAFGDSLTHGTGADAKESYPAVLQQLIGREVLNAGIPGEVSANGLKRLPKLLDKYQPDLLLLCHGGNDMLRKLDEAALIDNLRAMVQHARKRDIPVVLIGVPQPNPIMLNGAKFYYYVAKAFEVPYEGTVIAKILSQPALKSDTVHPNAKGYRVMAEAVHELLKQAKAVN